MKRIDKAHELFPDGVDLGDGAIVQKEEYIKEFCPYNLGVDDTDSAYYDNGSEEDIQDKGCRGITCEECWNKEVEVSVLNINSLCLWKTFDDKGNSLLIDSFQSKNLSITIEDENGKKVNFELDRENGLELMNLLTQKFK